MTCTEVFIAVDKDRLLSARKLLLWSFRNNCSLYTSPVSVSHQLPSGCSFCSGLRVGMDNSLDVFVFDKLNNENGLSLLEIRESICKTLSNPNAVVSASEFNSYVYRVEMRNVEG